jgi:hypothetical protein
LQGTTSITGVSRPNNAGWTPTLVNQSNVKFSGGVNAALWDSSNGAENIIGTIDFTLTSSGCISFQTGSNSYLFSFITLEFRPVSGAFTKCIAAGSVTLATSNDDLRERTVRFVAPGVNGNDQVEGPNDNSYSLCNVPPQSIIDVDPTTYPTHLNTNVRTSDIVAITNHILGTNLLTENFKIVAADVNADIEIDVRDILVVQREILGITINGMNSSWVYPTDASLDDLDYLVTPPKVLETNYGFSDVTSGASLDFTAIKLGDVSIDNQDYDKTLVTKVIEISNASLKKGQTGNIPVFLKDVNEMVAMSLALKFKTGAINITGINSGTLNISSENDYVIDRERGMLNMILVNLAPDVKIDASKPAFYLQVKAKQNLRELNTVLELTSDKVDNELFMTAISNKSSNSPARLEIEWSKNLTIAATDFVELVSANPFKNEIIVEITSELQQQATFALFGMNGKLIRQGKIDLTKGINRVPVIRNEFPAPSGAYILKIQAEDGRKTAIKMVKH